MTPLHPEQFTAFFQALHGYEPFPWQRKLAQRPWLEGPGLPAWHCLLPAARRPPSTLPYSRWPARPPFHPRSGQHPSGSIFFVVDRRVIVDEAFDRARRVARCLRTSTDPHGRSHPILAQVAGALRLSGGLDLGQDPLVCRPFARGVFSRPGLGQDPDPANRDRQHRRPDRLASAVSRLRIIPRLPAARSCGSGGQ